MIKLGKNSIHFYGFLLLALSVALPPMSVAGSFQVSPIRVQLTPGATTAAISVRNDSSTESVVLQMRVMDWKQVDGEDIYTPSTELIATPPIFTILPSGTQTVRVGLRKTVQTDVQQTFRLYLTEVPPAPKEGFQGLQVALNIGIPIFVAPKTATGTPPVWRATLTPEGMLGLTGANAANSHVQVLDAQIYDEQDNTAVAVLQEPRYLLAGQSSTWKLALTRRPKGTLRLTIRTDAGTVETKIPLGLPTP
jgi:fimbrial chaperone protein